MEYVYLLVYCEMVTDIWEDISVMINEVFNIDLLLNDFHKIVGLLEIGTKNEVINMIISIVRWNIWKRRCDYKYDSTYTKTDSLICKIKNIIRQHIIILVKCKFIIQNVALHKLLQQTMVLI